MRTPISSISGPVIADFRSRMKPGMPFFSKRPSGSRPLLTRRRAWIAHSRRHKCLPPTFVSSKPTAPVASRSSLPAARRAAGPPGWRRAAPQTVARSGGHFKDAAALEMAIDDCLEFVRRHYGREGLFVIENFLLRSTVDAHLLRICGNADCDGCADDDPYSYRIHVILPADAGRFTSMAFREFVESVIRAETPAHILPKVCWIGREDQQRLDHAYRAWITAGPDAEASGALARLRDRLESGK